MRAQPRLRALSEGVDRKKLSTERSTVTVRSIRNYLYEHFTLRTADRVSSKVEIDETKGIKVYKPVNRFKCLTDKRHCISLILHMLYRIGF